MLGFDGVTKRFGPVTALERCTFSARPGRLTGFLGPNGAGKTTAMRAVFGLVALEEGTVRWHGAPVRAADRARFGYMPEERGLYPRMRVGTSWSTSASCAAARRRPCAAAWVPGWSASAWPTGPRTGWTRCRTATSSGSS